MNSKVEDKFTSYPPRARKRLQELRRLILDVAKENDLGPVEETLKWSEPSYLVSGGSTVRIDWKAKRPEVCGVYFNCNTKLVATFKEIYTNDFQYEGNRAIIVPVEGTINDKALRHCIELSLKYHSLKKLPLLGA